MMIISGMSDAMSKRRQEERKSGGQKEFCQILEEARHQNDSDVMAGKTIGYTRDGLAYVGEIRRRTYN